jgi:hypothetical protein
MKVQVRRTLTANVAEAFKVCTDQRSQQAIYERMGVLEPRVKREGRAPNVKLRVTRKVPVNPPAALRKFVSGANEVAHTESWRASADGYIADLAIDIKSVPVRITGTKALHPEKKGCAIEWRFDVSSGIPLLGTMIASFAGEEIRKSVEQEYRELTGTL